MIITLVSVIVFVILVGVTFLGGRLARVLPEEQLSAESKDAMKLALGLVATMTAILLGLLISSAKGSFDTARSQVMQMAAKVALLDRVLKLYGPEAMDARHALRDAIADGVRRTWPAERSGPVRLDPNQAISSVAKPLLIALVLWLVVIFFGFSLLAPTKASNTLALIAGAFSVACAVFLILELDHPFAGVIRIPSEPMVNVLNRLGK